MANSNNKNNNKSTSKAQKTIKKTAKKVVKKATKTKKGRVIIAIAVFLVVIFVLTYYFVPPFNKFVNDTISNIFLDNTNSGNNNNNKQDIDTPIVKRTEVSDTVIHFIDVDQGDCIFIELPDDKYCIIDASYKNNEINNKMVNYIKALEVTQIDYLIATHTDSDHIGGMGAIFDNFEVKKAFRPYVEYTGTKYSFPKEFNTCNSKLKKDTATYGNFLNYIYTEKYHDGEEEKSCEWEYFNYESDFGGGIEVNEVQYTYTFDFLTPSKPVPEISYKDANGYSPIIKFTYMDFDVMFTGDAEQEAEAEFVSLYSSNASFVDVELLKVGHHGSNLTSTSDPFLNLVNPEYAVISCGTGNEYGHPHQETLDKLYNKNVSLFRTDKQGTIVCSISGLGVPTITKDREGTDLYLK